MNKKILFIGNNHGRRGIPKNIFQYTAFFKDEIGGNWYDSEFVTLLNPSKNRLKEVLDQLRSESLEFLIIIYCGLSNQKRKSTSEINRAGGRIAATELRNIAQKQVTIYDCCPTIPDSAGATTSKRMPPKSSTGESEIRTFYEAKIKESAPQQVSLYASSIGQTAHDSPDGGVYSGYLLGVARAIQTDYISVRGAHELASLLTTNQYKSQVPEIACLKSPPSEELILSINPQVRKPGN